MSLDELLEWEAYYYFEPWGGPADDARWAQMYALYFSGNAKPGTPQPVWLDRDPEETARKKAEADAARTLEDKLEEFFGSRVAPETIVLPDIDQPTDLEA